MATIRTIPTPTHTPAIIGAASVGAEKRSKIHEVTEIMVLNSKQDCQGFTLSGLSQILLLTVLINYADPNHIIKFISYHSY